MRYISLLVVFVGIVGFAHKFGSYMDKRLKSSAKTRLYNIMDLTIFSNKHLIVAEFCNLFDRVFDTTDRGRPLIKRSLIASYMVFSAAVLTWAIAYPERARDLPFGLPTTIIGLAVMILLFNPVGDFFSLWQTRIIIRYMETVKIVKYVICIIVDLVLTIFIFLVMMIIWRIFLDLYTSIVLGNIPGTFFYYFELLCRIAPWCVDRGMVFTQAQTLNDILFILFCTTLFTSVWLWLFVAGALMWPVFRWLNRIFEVKEHPVTTLMTIGGLLVSPPVLLLGALAVSYFSVTPNT